MKQIKSIPVHKFELLQFYDDGRTTLSELSSSSTDIVGGYSIEIYFENLGKI